jgi:3,2-trans-enoyl-CoA isomerase
MHEGEVCGTVSHASKHTTPVHNITGGQRLKTTGSNVLVDMVGETAMLVLCNAPENSFNVAFLQELQSVLEQLRDDPNVKSVILTSKFIKRYSAGFNYSEQYPPNQNEFVTLWKAMEDQMRCLYAFPKPVVAAVSGWASSGGTLLAACCDYRIGIDNVKMNFVEARLNICAPAWQIAILERCVCSPKFAEQMLQLSRIVDAEDALAMGLLDEVVINHKELIQSALHKAHTMSRVWTRGSVLSKQTQRATVVSLMDETENIPFMWNQVKV